MATKVFLGRQQARPQVGTLTVNTADTGGTITVTVGNVWDVVVTPTTTNTTTTAAEIAAACEASEEGAFAEITWESAGAVVTFTGPDDGAPITVAKADGGTNSTTLATTTTPLSPHDVNDAENWDTGSVPGNGDTAVFEHSDVDARYNLAAFAAATVDVVRRSTHTGRLGLPDVNAEYGYREYRPTHFETAGTAGTFEQADADGAGQVRVEFAGAAVAVSVLGPGAGQSPGGEVFEFHGAGFTAGAVLNVTGAAVAVAPLQGQSATVPTLRGIGSTIRTGPGAAVTTAALTDCRALLYAAPTTLTMDRGGEVEVVGSGGLTTGTVDGGTLVWRSTGGVGAVTVGSAGVLDVSRAPGPVAVTGLTVHEGAAVSDPAGRLTTPAVTFARCGVQDVTLDLGTGYTLTKS